MPFTTPFCLRDAAQRGLSREQVETWVSNRVVSRHGRGVFLPSGHFEPAATLSAAMFGGSRAAPFIFASQVHGIWTPPLRLPAMSSALRADRIHGNHLVLYGTLRLPSSTWTAVNLARGQALPGAVVPLDCALRSGLSRGALEEASAELDGAPGSAILVSALKLADGRVESPLEAYARGVFHLLKLPDAQPQLELTIRGKRYRPDFAWPDARVIVEVDGEVKYRDQGEISYERRRQRELEADGWRVVRLTWKDLKDPNSPSLRHLAQVMTALVPS